MRFWCMIEGVWAATAPSPPSPPKIAQKQVYKPLKSIHLLQLPENQRDIDVKKHCKLVERVIDWWR